MGWTFTPQQIDTFADGGVTLVVDHPEYRYETALSEDNIAELLTDLRPDGN